MTSNCLTGEDPILGIAPAYPAKNGLAEECVELGRRDGGRGGSAEDQSCLQVRQTQG